VIVGATVLVGDFGSGEFGESKRLRSGEAAKRLFCLVIFVVFTSKFLVDN
jgi:hypothetical protein